MELLFILSKENLDLAREELLALSSSKEYEQEDKALIVNTKKFEFERLAFTNYVLEFLFTCKREELLEKAEEFDWNKYYKDNFCIRCYKSGNEERMNKLIAKKVWNRVQNPKVKLKNSRTRFEFFFINDKVYVGKRMLKLKPYFDKRKPHLRPGFMPISIHPKLARAMVNLSSVKKGETVYDPFCGTGGILIEAGLIGCKIIGNDINNQMIKKAKQNFEFYKIKDYKLSKKDATKAKEKTDVIVTDPPYGRRSSLHKQKIEELYKNFLDNAYEMLEKNKKLIIIFPDKFNVEHKFKKQAEFNQYIHKTLTRRIEILVKS